MLGKFLAGARLFRTEFSILKYDIQMLNWIF